MRVLNTAEHLFEVNMHIDLSATKLTALKLVLPAWIPGSYMIRDFAKNLHALHCQPDDLISTQLSKHEWEVSAPSGNALGTFCISYIIYAYDLSVRSAYINDEYAFFNGTSLFLCPVGFENSVYNVTILPSPTNLLPQVVTSLPAASHTHSSANPCYVAHSYFELIDHPFLIGCFNDHCFDVMGYRFHLVFTGQHNIDFARMEKDVSAIIEHHITLFGDFPCNEYWFITLVCDVGFGGLEHLASTVLQYSRFDLPMLGGSDTVSKEYQQFLALCSHELFHTWHVKRIKPQIMHQPNLLSEVYTPQLWIYEGFTSFFDDLSLARTKLITPQQYVQILSESITRLMRTPGRLKQSAAESSFTAWHKFYKQDEGSVNHIVSYYNKGAVIALCLDITLRQQSNNVVSLNNVMACLWQQYGKTNIGTPDDVILTLCKTEFDIDVSSFLYLATQTTMDLPLPTLFHSIGLKLSMRSQYGMQDKGGPAPLLAKHDIGGTLCMVDKQLKVMSVLENRALASAGVMVGDVIVAFNKWQCDDFRFCKLVNMCKLGDKIPIDILRDSRLSTLSFEVVAAVPDTCDISIEDNGLFLQWLNLDS